VRDLTRLELITEAVRAALEVASIAGHLLDGLVDEEWATSADRSACGESPPGQDEVLATGDDDLTYGSWNISTGTG
jgi:hypothetical protein